MLITQSIVKALEAECPRKVYDQYVDGNEITNSHKQRGAYFETLCLGSGANGKIVTALPLLKNGNKSIDQIRIEQQAQRFKDLFDPMHPDYCGRPILNKQLVIEHGGKRGTLDFTTEGIIWDLKLTADMDGYWQNPGQNDLIQQVFYPWLYEQKYGVKMESKLIIFEYGQPAMRVKEIKINISQQATQEALARFDKIEEAVGEWGLLEEWPRVPTEKSCSSCSLSCPKRVIRDNVIYQEVNL